MLKVYESMRTGDVPSNTKESIVTLLKYSARTVYLVYQDVQQQTDGSSCGVFALAFAHTLCDGNDPSRMTYSQDFLCSRFLSCLEKRKITSFESGQSPFIKSRFKVYCLCRLPDSGDTGFVGLL